MTITQGTNSEGLQWLLQVLLSTLFVKTPISLNPGHNLLHSDHYYTNRHESTTARLAGPTLFGEDTKTTNESLSCVSSIEQVTL